MHQRQVRAIAARRVSEARSCCACCCVCCTHAGLGGDHPAVQAHPASGTVPGVGLLLDCEQLCCDRDPSRQPMGRVFRESRAQSRLIDVVRQPGVQGRGCLCRVCRDDVYGCHGIIARCKRKPRKQGQRRATALHTSGCNGRKKRMRQRHAARGGRMSFQCAVTAESAES